MHLDALCELRYDAPDAIARLAETEGLNPVVAERMAILLLANDGNLAGL